MPEIAPRHIPTLDAPVRAAAWRIDAVAGGADASAADVAAAVRWLRGAASTTGRAPGISSRAA